eukprot:3507250-Pyramimonas_sp.AAC.1
MEKEYLQAAAHCWVVWRQLAWPNGTWGTVASCISECGECIGANFRALWIISSVKVASMFIHLSLGFAARPRKYSGTGQPARTSHVM